MVCERFNKTLKEKIWRVFTHNSIQKQKFPQNYKKFLQDILNSYNNSYHRSIKTEPAKVNKDNEALIYKILYPERAEFITFKYQIGDYVRIVEKKNIFSKGYTQNWSKEIFIIRNKVPTNPPRYMIKDLNAKRKPLKYYTEELQKVNFNEYPFDTFLVINEKSDFLQVEKLNSDREISWIAKKSFENG
jgi:hypothetical protein